jgi:hypothetical protein
MHDFEFARLGENPSTEEIKSEIERLKILKSDYRSKDQGLKVLLNSVYGVLGFKHFSCYNRTIAETITTQSRDIIQYTIKIFDDYFANDWADDKEVHDKIGITKAIPPTRKVVNYADTDSVFIVLDAVWKGTDFKGTFNEFVMLLNQHLFPTFIERKMGEYADKYYAHRTRQNGDSSMRLELEEVLHTGIFLAKKKYIKEVSWADGVQFDKLKKIKYKGIEVNQSSIPMWVRDRIKDTVNFILSKPNLDLSDLGGWISTHIKPKFDQTDLENICRIKRIGNYEKYILDDCDNLEVAKGCEPHVKGAGTFNHIMKKTGYNKYQRLGTTDRVMFYRTTHPEHPWFSFIQGEYPAEFALECDRSEQFQSIYLGPINNIISSMGMQPLKPDLVVFESLF